VSSHPGDNAGSSRIQGSSSKRAFGRAVTSASEPALRMRSPASTRMPERPDFRTRRPRCHRRTGLFKRPTPATSFVPGYATCMKTAGPCRMYVMGQVRYTAHGTVHLESAYGTGSAPRSNGLVEMDASAEQPAVRSSRSEPDSGAYTCVDARSACVTQGALRRRCS